MGLFSKITDPLGLRKKTRKELHRFGKKTGLSSAFDFEKFHAKYIWDAIRKNPQRLLYGSIDPFSTKMWNEVLGTDYDPMVNQLGGATEQAFAAADARGIDTSSSRGAHQVAGMIAGAMGGGALSAAAGSGAGALTASGSALGPAATAGATYLTPTVATGLVTTGAAATDAASLPDDFYGPTPWDPGPGEHLDPLGGLNRMYLGLQNPYSYGRVGFGGEQRLVGNARGGLARVAYRRYH